MQVRDILHHYIGQRAIVVHVGQTQEIEREITETMLMYIDSYTSIRPILKDLHKLTERQADEMNLESNFKPHLKGMDEPLFTAEEVHTLCKNGYNVFNLSHPEIILI